MTDLNTIESLREILAKNKTIAVVGLSANWHRPSFFAAKYMQKHGYNIIPVNPMCDEILNQKCYKTILDVPHKIDIVNCFRKSGEIENIALDAIKIKAKVLWMQLDIRNDLAKKLAMDSGLKVVEDRCVKIEHARIFGGLNYCGVNTKVISSKRPKWLN